MSRILKIILLIILIAAVFQKGTARHRVIISTDIGGTDPDDFQSMIHFLMYADRFETEGLISSPYGPGRKDNILSILDLYEKDYQKLKTHSEHFPTADKLRSVTKQGAIQSAPGKGWSNPSEGSHWIISCALRKDPRPLWLLVWGGLEDIAQALHDKPEIAEKIRVYWIGGPNKKWSANAYQYIAEQFPHLWMIEANSSYRGWFIDDDTKSGFGNLDYYNNYIKGNGALGLDFGNYYKGEIKMGDTPSVAYLLYGNPHNPQGAGWGGSFVPLQHSSRRIFSRQTTSADKVPVFSLVEWVFQGPSREKNKNMPCLWLEIEGQRFAGYHEGKGIYRARFVPKKTGTWQYQITSPVKELDGLQGQFTSIDPWPGERHPDDIAPLNRWWSDRQEETLYMGPHQGARTVGRWRESFLQDWAKRWTWLSEGNLKEP